MTAGLVLVLVGLVFMFAARAELPLWPGLGLAFALMALGAWLRRRG